MYRCVFVQYTWKTRGRVGGKERGEREVRRGKDEERGERRESCLCTEAKDQWQTVGQVTGDGFGLRHREAIVSFTGLLSCLTARTMYVHMYNVCKQLMYITLKCCGFETHQGQLFFQSKTVVLAFAFICDLFAVTRTTHYCLTYRLIVLDR